MFITKSHLNIAEKHARPNESGNESNFQTVSATFPIEFHSRRQTDNSDTTKPLPLTKRGESFAYSTDMIDVYISADFIFHYIRSASWNITRLSKASNFQAKADELQMCQCFAEKF